jgi:hypothetical protein
VGASVVEICLKHIQAPPEPPSARMGGPVSPDLEQLLLRCLAKGRADRPANAGVLLSEFEACAVAGSWTRADAAAWWQQSRGAGQIPADPSTNTANLQEAPGQTVVYQRVSQSDGAR